LGARTVSLAVAGDPPRPSHHPYTEADLVRLAELGARPFAHPEDIRRVLDRLGYEEDWRTRYEIKSVRRSLHSPRITCIDGAILGYGLLELLFPTLRRRLLAIHRRDRKGEECGHCVTLYWSPSGKVGCFSKSSYTVLHHRDATFADEMALAVSLGRSYMKIGLQPLYFGVTTLEEVAGDLDWRGSSEPLNAISDRLAERYQYSFMLGNSPG
jgi:hypothetical protein